MIPTLIAGGIAAWLAVAFGVAVGIGRAIRIADREQAAQQAPALRLVS